MPTTRRRPIPQGSTPDLTSRAEAGQAALDRIAVHLDTVRAEEAALDRVVRDALDRRDELGITVTDIATVLGIGRRGVHKRYPAVAAPEES